MVNKRLLVKKISEMLEISRFRAYRMLRKGEIHLLKIDGKNGIPSHVDLSEYESNHKTCKRSKHGKSN